MSTRIEIENDVYRILQEENTSSVFTRDSIQSKINTEVGLVCRGHYMKKDGGILKSPLLPFLKNTSDLPGNGVEVKMPDLFYGIHSVKDGYKNDVEIEEDARKDGYYVTNNSGIDVIITYQEKPVNMTTDADVCSVPTPYDMAILPYLVAGNLLYDTEEQNTGLGMLNTAYQKISDMYNNYSVPMTSRRRKVKVNFKRR